MLLGELLPRFDRTQGLRLHVLNSLLLLHPSRWRYCCLSKRRHGVTFQNSWTLVEFYATVTLKVARDCSIVEAALFTGKADLKRLIDIEQLWRRSVAAWNSCVFSSWQLLSQSIHTPPITALESSLPSSQQPACYAKCVHSTPSHLVNWRSSSVLSLYGGLGPPSGLFPSYLHTRTLHATLPSPTVPLALPRSSHHPWFDHPNHIRWGVWAVHSSVNCHQWLLTDSRVSVLAADRLQSARSDCWQAAVCP